ncbi:BlaI/MecI/CopY family transcriptional regulator [Streptomyces sp. NPDC056944]|uniref:BlaI/MecI/CopY family transcriptional regulator n=1 Tax=unclassified Streptomyces TaxID=2593676 RepID=UPI003632F3B9
MRRLGELEAEIMDRLWAWERPATVREIVDDINRGRRVAYTTVMTVADILHRKGWLRREKSGRAWLYEPVRGREEYTAGLMRDALGDSQDRPAALLRFVEVISDEDMAALDAALRAARGDQGTPPGEGARPGGGTRPANGAGA